MLTLLGSLLGFGTSFLPSVLDYFKQGRDQLHELALMDKQIQAQKSIAKTKLQMTNVEADIRETEALHEEQATTIIHAARWMATLSASIRPVVTYLFVSEYLIITWSIAWLIIDQRGINIEVLRDILNNDFMALLSAMISFWFGNRTFGKRRL